MICFMSVTFIYMDFCIILKWTTDWSARENAAPGIIGLMIDMPLKAGDEIEYPLWSDGTD